MTKAISCGGLVKPGSWRVHSRFGKAVNFTGGEGMVFVVKPEVGGGPLSIVLDGTDFADFCVSLEVTDRQIIIDGTAFRRDGIPLYRDFPSLPSGAEKNYAANLPALKAFLCARSPKEGVARAFFAPDEMPLTCNFERAVQRRASSAAELFRGGYFRKGTLLLRGLGPGLTPAGDDAICGLLCGLNLTARLCGRDVSAVSAEIVREAMGENLISNALIRCAGEGRFFEPLRLLAETASAQKPDFAAAGRRLSLCGASSGFDSAAGFALALELWLGQENLALAAGGINGFEGRN